MDTLPKGRRHGRPGMVQRASGWYWPEELATAARLHNEKMLRRFPLAKAISEVQHVGMVAGRDYAKHGRFLEGRHFANPDAMVGYLVERKMIDVETFIDWNQIATVGDSTLTTWLFNVYQYTMRLHQAEARIHKFRGTSEESD